MEWDGFESCSHSLHYAFTLTLQKCTYNNSHDRKFLSLGILTLRMKEIIIIQKGILLQMKYKLPTLKMPTQERCKRRAHAETKRKTLI